MVIIDALIPPNTFGYNYANERGYTFKTSGDESRSYGLVSSTGPFSPREICTFGTTPETRLVAKRLGSLVLDMPAIIFDHVVGQVPSDATEEQIETLAKKLKVLRAVDLRTLLPGEVMQFEITGPCEWLVVWGIGLT